jgi:SAM-dependent methyltransferase
VTFDAGQRARSFGAVAELYEAGRPGYPLEALRACLPPGATRALDLAAGTGKLGRGLLELGLEVIGVEPDAELRALIPYAALDGTAEAIPLPDDAVDAVLVGQAFHWFDQERALAEMRRVVRPGGTLAMLWNAVDDSIDWVAQVADLVGMEDRASRFGEFTVVAGERHLVVPYVERYDADRLVANMASRSVVSLRAPDERDALLQQVRALAPPGAFDLPHVCNAHISHA